MIRIGLDIGSTTTKLIALGHDGQILYSNYQRHNADVKGVMLAFLHDLLPFCGDKDISLRLTGSVGMGLAERYELPFVQEVVAAATAIRQEHIPAQSLIDIGGEDAKVVFFKEGEATDLRMNGNCAGGTGAFIDQMAIILGITPDELNRLALKASQIYPIASRCGVFCKTDIQNLIARNVSREDIAASIFHAVAVQTVTTLAHGYDIQSPVLFCGGPLTFLPALRKAFMDYMHWDEQDILLPGNGELLPARGTALTDTNHPTEKLSALIKRLEASPATTRTDATTLPRIFSDESDHRQWTEKMSGHEMKQAEWHPGIQEAYLGIDSGSTTTKIVVLNERNERLFSFYRNNNGNPVEAVRDGLVQLQETCQRERTELHFRSSCSTGYGEDLIKAAFQLHSGIVETIAHYRAARLLDEQVSFILDIGGQDMKAIFVNHGVIDRIELNEACSSGCGSFMETFAKSLEYTVAEFAQRACRSTAPCDLGTRCTVFMNSKVKQALREGATVDDIAAGLAYSVVKNCLYKVLKLKGTECLGKHIVVQGGTMRNDAVVRALERLTDVSVTRPDSPELMGAFGCALYAKEHPGGIASLTDMLEQAAYTVRQLHCQGCENQCAVQCFRFANDRRYYSGNRCERVFNNGKIADEKGLNAYHLKEELLFNRQADIEHPRLTIGIPRALNMYEEYPFWHRLFTSCDIQVCLSDVSDYAAYERSARMVMSDNICFPAKLVHSHIANLQAKAVNRIFMPFVVFERKGADEQNSYNCPIVTGYSAVIRNVQPSAIPLDTPVFGFKDSKLLKEQCLDYLSTLGIDRRTGTKAFIRAEAEQERFCQALHDLNRHIMEAAETKGQICILLAGRPYHADPLIQHKVSELLVGMGLHVITDDIVRQSEYDKEVTPQPVHFLPQWTYPNRILKAAAWTTRQGARMQFMQLTSFGCGPDAFLTDEVRDVLLRADKPHMLLKLDDILNVGSMKLRIRSLTESLATAGSRECPACDTSFRTTPPYTRDYRGRTLLVPYFSPTLSPLIPSVLRVAGYQAESLAVSDRDSCEWGLRYANNEVCYPATLVVGDVVKAFKSGRYQPSESVIAITQTGGQCRASNYLPLIQKALIDAGYSDVPVVSLTFGSGVGNAQPAFRFNWLKLLPVAVRTILYGDTLNKFYHASAVREQEVGSAYRLRDLYLRKGADLIENGHSGDLFSYLSLAAHEFGALCRKETRCPPPRVGVVGEIYLKFNAFAQRGLTDWLITQGIEVVPPILTDFFLQAFVNRKVNMQARLTRRKPLSDIAWKAAYRKLWSLVEEVNRIGALFPHFTPFENIFSEARRAEGVVPLSAQFGEGWLLPAEILTHAHSGVAGVVSLQPFGCIANQIVSRGIEKRIRTLCPDLPLLSLDFDGGVSDVNILNRLLLFTDRLRR